MNCMALELPCAPLGHIMGMFSPRSLNTATGRPIRCKFTGVYVPSSSTPRLTSWSKNGSSSASSSSSREELIPRDVDTITPRYAQLTIGDDIPQESTTLSSEGSVDLDSDSGHSSDVSVEDTNPDTKYMMPLASEAFETVMLELKDEEESLKAALGSDNSLSDCSEDSFDFGMHSVFSESPTLDRGVSRIVENECSQVCCKQKSENSEDKLDSSAPDGSDACGLTRRVRFADHVRVSQRSRGGRKTAPIKSSNNSKPILKSPSVFH